MFRFNEIIWINYNADEKDDEKQIAQIKISLKKMMALCVKQH